MIHFFMSIEDNGNVFYKRAKSLRHLEENVQPASPRREAAVKFWLPQQTVSWKVYEELVEERLEAHSSQLIQ